MEEKESYMDVEKNNEGYSWETYNKIIESLGENKAKNEEANKKMIKSLGEALNPTSGVTPTHSQGNWTDSKGTKKKK